MFDLFGFIRQLIGSMLAIFSFGKKKLSNSLSVYVKTNTGNTLAVDLEPHMDIKDVKEMVAPRLGLEPQELKIIFAGRELSDTTTISECDLGQQSIIHVVKSRPTAITTPQKRQAKPALNATISEEPSPEEQQQHNKPLSETMSELTVLDERNDDRSISIGRTKAHFFVYCSQCEKVCTGKLRVRCGICGSGAFTVHRDPTCWDDVLKRKRITGHCENYEVPCVENDEGEPPFTEFYFKCSEHSSGGEKDFAAPLSLIKTNHKNIPCIACTDTSETILVFPCVAGHVSCLDCFRQYCVTRLLERQFVEHPTGGYTLQCPAGCDNSFIEDVHHFKLLNKEQYERYQRFATEEFVLKNGGVLCPQPGCGMGLLVDPECRRIQCQNGCGYVFCRSCLQGYHIGECFETPTPSTPGNEQGYAIDPLRASEARWDEATKIAIKVTTKPCPQCRTATERDGGCMHMVCTRSGCGFEWCWVCQTPWTRDCMAAHWFG
ncbi:E3 ubiquitin-protein ligase parkin isoform X2 [Anopheles gambiae]|uniref:E3 ubiquitin-protein ligase parkin n=2 Tax=gambiae species complex TaxID=44542 RepID=A0A6E8VQ57_ANOCL|nr:E3 ubiquitin-protein ligase parkin [Anopheles coluzzii]XP_316606.3 E3 ubiquitin-protein ligase parkin isoform X2 [Anopheles gambiae]